LREREHGEQRLGAALRQVHNALGVFTFEREAA
jgi:hypothetical protein